MDVSSFEISLWLRCFETDGSKQSTQVARSLFDSSLDPLEQFPESALSSFSPLSRRLKISLLPEELPFLSLSIDLKLVLLCPPAVGLFFTLLSAKESCIFEVPLCIFSPKPST